MTASRNQPVRILIVGAGRMGCAHAQAYARISDFRVVGVVNRGAERRLALSRDLGGVAEFSDPATALEQLRPDGVCIATYPNTHVDQALLALQAGAHVFVEKPMAQDVTGARHVLEAAEQAGLVVLVGAELDLDALCQLQANLWLRAIRGSCAIGDNQRAAVDCLRIALAADEAMRTGRVVELDA